MDELELIEALDVLLKQHAGGIRGSIHQGSYKDDIFKPFAAPYGGDRIAGDVLLHALRERGGHRDGTEGSGRLWEVCRMWDEWRYAWDHHPNQWEGSQTA